MKNRARRLIASLSLVIAGFFAMSAHAFTDFSAFDSDGDGLVSYEEFIAAVEGIYTGCTKNELQSIFAVADQDADNALDTEELINAILLLQLSCPRAP